MTDLGRSIGFYRDVLGLRLRARWPEGAYLEAGGLWLCLALDPAAGGPARAEYTDVACVVGAAAFDELSRRAAAAAPIWRQNRSEGRSLYCLDPDGHKLELHVGSLTTRLAHYRANPVAGRLICDE